MDLLTKAFFASHIPITILVDLSAWYPNWKIFELPHAIRDFYLSTFNDPLFAAESIPGGWFRGLIFLEGVVQLPICFFVVAQYWRGREKSFLTRAVIFAYSIQVMTATWACLCEVLSFSSLTSAERLSLLGFYLPYLVVPVIMAWNSFRSIASDLKRDQRELHYLQDAHTQMAPSRNKVIVITGANSGVGFGIVQQLIDQEATAMAFGDVKLTLVLSVRNEIKADSIVERLQTAIHKFQDMLKIDFVYMDLLSMQSIENAFQFLLKTYSHVDVFICNAGMALFSGIDIYKGTVQALTHPIMAVSEPNYKIQRVGGLSKDDLGATFQANFFGHYYLARRMVDAGLLARRGSSLKSIVIWMSSLEATTKTFKIDDLQAVQHELAYESSKRLIDIMWSSSDLGLTQYLVHPGFCSTNIVAEAMHPLLVPVIAPLWTAVFYFVRFCGSPFHTATAYNGAYAAACIATKPVEYDPTKKWGSAGSRLGEAQVVETRLDEIVPEEAGQVVQTIDRLTDEWIHRLTR